MKFLVVVFLAILAVVQAQFGLYHGFGASFGQFASLDAASASGARDPRANTGPVVFPAAPPDNGETSGVVVGASGYGFVPPQSPSRFHFTFY